MPAFRRIASDRCELTCQRCGWDTDVLYREYRQTEVTTVIWVCCDCFDEIGAGFDSEAH